MSMSSVCSIECLVESCKTHFVPMKYLYALSQISVWFQAYSMNAGVSCFLVDKAVAGHTGNLKCAIVDCLKHARNEVPVPFSQSQ